MKSQYGPEKGERVFYATANKHKMKPRSHMPKGATQSPKGDLGDRRVAECDSQRGLANHGGKLSGSDAFGSNIGTIGSIGEK